MTRQAPIADRSQLSFRGTRNLINAKHTQARYGISSHGHHAVTK